VCGDKLVDTNHVLLSIALYLYKNNNMILSMILFVLMVSVFLAYVGYIWAKYGVQKSISESYYVLPEKRNWLFVAFTWLFAFPAMILGNSLLMLFAGGGIVFVGAAAAMHTFPTRAVHLTGAIGGMILACLAMITQFGMWWLVPAVGLGILITALLDKKHLMWWAECAIFIAISIALGFSIF
jgi:hypothetical protein